MIQIRDYVFVTLPAAKTREITAERKMAAIIYVGAYSTKG